MNKKLLSIALIAVFALSISGTVQTVSGQQQFIETNFEVWFYTQAGSRTTESYALYIKQALAPLGISVKVVAKPFGQFVGDLLHYTTGHPFDLAQIRFGGGGPTPSFMWKFHSTETSFGDSMYQLDNPDWQAWQEQDVGVTTEEVDNLLYSIDYELNLTKKTELIQQFNTLYFTKLLYDYPMVSRIFRTAMWKGYGGPNNELWDPQEGIMGSRALGAGWTDATPAERVSNHTHMRLATVTPGTSGMFDPFQSYDSATSDLTRYLHTSLLDFDKNFKAHPGIAWNYFRHNVTINGVNAISYTYFLGNQSYWAPTVDVDGNPVPARMVDANDFKLSYDMYMNPYTVLNGKKTFRLPILGYWTNSTLRPNDTFTVAIDPQMATLDDYFTYGASAPIPSHLLGGHLTASFDNGTVVDIGTVAQPTVAFNPQKSDQWKLWASLEGHSLVGPYDIVDFKSGQYYSYHERSDYWFPRESDVNTYYDAAKFSAWEAASNLKFNIFAPHDNAAQPDDYYWAYTDDGSKPTHQTIQTFDYVVIDDINAELLKFEAGEIDAFGSTALGAQTVKKHEADPNLVVKSVVPLRGPELLVFNLLNPNLKYFDVRLAIAHAIDKQQLVKIHDGYAEPHYSVVWAYSPMYKEVQYKLDYDYNTSRDLMRGLGYKAAETPDIQNEAPPIPIDTALGKLGTDYLFIFTTLSLGVLVLFRKRK